MVNSCETLPQGTAQFPICNRGKDFYHTEEIHQNAENGMQFPQDILLGAFCLEAFVAHEIAFLHDMVIKLAGLPTQLRIIERHLRHRQTKILHHEIAKRLPRLH